MKDKTWFNLFLDTPDAEPVAIQWYGICTQVYKGMPLENELLVAIVLPVYSSGLSVVSQCVPIMQITTGLPLGHCWVLASASVVPVASQCTRSSSSLPVCYNYANGLWIATRRPIGDSMNQCGSSVVCPVPSQRAGGLPVLQLCELTLDYHSKLNHQS